MLSRGVEEEELLDYIFAFLNNCGGSAPTVCGEKNCSQLDGVLEAIMWTGLKGFHWCMSFYISRQGSRIWVGSVSAIQTSFLIYTGSILVVLVEITWSIIYTL